MKAFSTYVKGLYRYSKSKFILNLVFLILNGLTSGIGIVILIPLLSLAGITGQSSLDFPFLDDVLHLLKAFSPSVQLIFILLAYMALIILHAVINRKVSILNTEIIQGYTKHLRVSLYEKLIRAEWTCFIGKKRSDITNAFTNEITRVASGTIFFLKIISQSIVAIFQLYVAFMLSVPLTVFVLLCGALIIKYMNRTFRESKKLGRSLRRVNQELMSRITEQLNGIKEAKSYGIEDAQLENFTETTEKTRRNLIDFTRLQSESTMFYSIGAAVAISLLFFVSVVYLQIQPTALLVIIYVFAKLWPSFSSFQNNLQNVISMMPAYTGLKDLMDDLARHEETIGPVADGANTIPSDATIRFENVGFCYDHTEGFGLSGLDFEIKAKKMTALVGRSGAGKSTIVDMLLGLLRPTEGHITVGGKAIDETTMAQWRKRIGYVPQDPFLFNGTIKENLLRFTPGASDREIDAALEMSAAVGFVQKLSQGVDTVIGDNGVRLSGGERQRIVLARALLRKPEILVLDEATSALDSENEYRIQQAIESLSGKLTVLIIAHRLSTIKNADTIIVIDAGKIVEQGSYRMLTEEKNGFFKNVLDVEKNTIE